MNEGDGGQVETERSASFGVTLRRLRETAGLTQEQLAEKAGLSVQGIAALENGRRRHPYPHTVDALGDALALSGDAQAALVATLSARNRPRAGSPVTPAVPPADVRLPPLPARLIGRERDLDNLSHILLQGPRILTLTGPGGVGKTSLALQLATDLSGNSPDGAAFVSLASVDDAALVLPTIVHALHLTETGARTARESLHAYLRDKHMLLVLDNFEQVLAASLDVLDLVDASAGLTVLATSRGPLRVRREREYPVHPLAVPALTRVPLVPEVEDNPAVRLFVERARTVLPSFELGRENAAAIAAICRRLDGLPLAIELAAAQVRVLSPMALLSRLDAVLPLLSGGARDLPERQRTMRRAIAWSYDLLDEPERTLFNTLSVFGGGWSLDAAEVVGTDENASAGDVLGCMAALAEQSLLVTENQDDGSTRYRFLLPIREFAVERLEHSGRAEETRRRHAAYYLRLSEQAADGLTGVQQVEWLSQLDLERDNLRTALDWLLSIRDWDGAARLGWNLWGFWWIRSYHAMTRVLEEGSRVQPVVRARALGVSGAMALGQGDIAYAETCCRESYDLFKTAGDEVSAARLGLVLGAIANARQDFRKAEGYLREASDVYRATGAHFWAALAVSALGMLPFGQGEYDRAEVLLREGHDLARRAGDRFSRYIALYNQARLAQRRGDDAKATALFREGLLFSLEVGDRANIAHCLEGLAAVAVTRGDAEGAARLLGGAQGLSEALASRVYADRPDTTSLREQTTEAVRARLDEDVWAAAWAAGHDLPLDAIVGDAQALAERLIAEPAPPVASVKPTAPVPGGLSAREVEVLQLMSSGLTNAEIAERLFLSEHTVRAHLRRIYHKLEITTRAEAVRFAVEHQLT